MRIAKLQLDPQNKQQFEIHGKGSVKYHLKANHVAEAKRWYWALNNAIQHCKDEAREEERRKRQESEVMDRLREQVQQDDFGEDEVTSGSEMRRNPGSIAGSENTGPTPGISKRPSVRTNYGDHQEPPSMRPYSANTDGDLGDDEEDDDDQSSHEPTEPPTSDALALAAHSARLQLDLLSQVALALQFEHAQNPELKLGDSSVVAAMASYESAVGSLKTLINDLLNMSKDRDTYWRYRMEKEVALRRLWEENMTKLAEEQETLEGQVVGERERRKKAKRALKQMLQSSDVMSRSDVGPVHDAQEGADILGEKLQRLALDRRSSIGGREIEVALSDSDSDDSDEFFDAIDAGEVEIVTDMPVSVKSPPVPTREGGLQETDRQMGNGLREQKLLVIKSSFTGYEEPPRPKLKMDADDRPKISLWVSCHLVNTTLFN
jgi:hypothetical protein